MVMVCINVTADNDYDGQVCLLGTGDIDRRRSCMSEGGFRLILISANLHLVCRPPPKDHYHMMICLDYIFQQGSANERGRRACLLSCHWPTASNQVKYNGRFSKSESETSQELQNCLDCRSCLCCPNCLYCPKFAQIRKCKVLYYEHDTSKQGA